MTIASPDEGAVDADAPFRGRGTAAVGAARLRSSELRPLPDVERALGWMVAGFASLYALTGSVGFGDFVRSVPAPAAVAIVALVAVPLLADALLAAAGRADGRAWAVSAGCYPLAVLIWAASFAEPLHATRPPWLVAMLVPAILQVTMATRSLRATAAATVGLAGCLALVLGPRGGVPLPAVLSEVALVAPFGVVLAAVVALVRRAARRAGEAQQKTLLELAAARFEDLTETERVRTDALVHDTILTTLLQAASAEQSDETDRAHRMAENALRVIAHVNRAGDLGAGVRLRAAVSAHEHRLDPAIRSFDIVLERRELEDLLLPAEAADALLTAVAEAMDNSVRHTEALRRTVHVQSLGPDGVRIEIEDDGQGFVHPSTAGEGIRDRILTPMLTVEGRAEVETALGRGTTVRLTWGSVSIADVRSVEARVAEVHR